MNCAFHVSPPPPTPYLRFVLFLKGELKADPLDTFVKGLRDGEQCKEAVKSKARAREKGEAAENVLRMRICCALGTVISPRAVYVSAVRSTSMTNWRWQ